MSVPSLAGAAASETRTIQYRAYICHSCADVRWAKWLQRWLESFRGDKDLIRRDDTGTIHTTLRPIFRSGDDMPAANALARDALHASRALIVICSPDGARSHQVDEQIRVFKLCHPERPVIPLMIAGEPGDQERECLPPSLRFRLDADGVIRGEPVELLVADAREEGPPRELALAQVAAQLLLGKSSEEAFDHSERGFRRAKRERQRQAGVARLKSGIKATIRGASIAAFLAFIALVSAWTYFDYQRRLTSAKVENLVKKYGAIDSAKMSTPEARPRATEAISTIAREATRDPRYETVLELLKSGSASEAKLLLKAVGAGQREICREAAVAACSRLSRVAVGFGASQIFGAPLK
jgi:hypothetical protein